jgi:hypothetical protein
VIAASKINNNNAPPNHIAVPVLRGESLRQILHLNMADHTRSGDDAKAAAIAHGTFSTSSTRTTAAGAKWQANPKEQE